MHAYVMQLISSSKPRIQNLYSYMEKEKGKYVLNNANGLNSRESNIGGVWWYYQGWAKPWFCEILRFFYLEPVGLQN